MVFGKLKQVASKANPKNVVKSIKKDAKQEEAKVEYSLHDFESDLRRHMKGEMTAKQLFDKVKQ